MLGRLCGRGLRIAPVTHRLGYSCLPPSGISSQAPHLPVHTLKSGCIRHYSQPELQQPRPFSPSCDAVRTIHTCRSTPLQVGSIGGHQNLEAAAKTMAGYGMGDSFGGGLDDFRGPEAHSAQPKKSVASTLEAMCSSAVRVADKIQASLIVVYTHTGVTAQLVAKWVAGC